jgi:hypothetical protein
VAARRVNDGSAPAKVFDYVNLEAASESVNNQRTEPLDIERVNPFEGTRKFIDKHFAEGRIAERVFSAKHFVTRCRPKPSCRKGR